MPLPSTSQRIFTVNHEAILKSTDIPFEILFVARASDGSENLVVALPDGVKLSLRDLGGVVSHSLLYFNILQAIITSSDEELHDLLASLRPKKNRFISAGNQEEIEVKSET